MDKQPNAVPAGEVVEKAKADALVAVLKEMHPEIQWAAFPLGDYAQYAEADAPEWLVSFGNEDQQLEEGLVDPYSTMLGDAYCEPAAWGISDKAAQLIQAHNKVFVAKYPNCDGPRQHVSAAASKLVQPEELSKSLKATIKASVKSAEVATTCEWLVSEGYASDDAHARKLIDVAIS